MTISRANDCYFICNHFVNAYFLYCHKNNIDIPIFNKDFFDVAFKALSKKSNGPKCKGINAVNLSKLNLFFKKEFVKVICDSYQKKSDIEDFKLDMVNLSYVIDDFSESMYIMYKNNVVLNFFKYVHQYVNTFFITYEIKKLSKKEFKELNEIERAKYIEKRDIENAKIKLIKKELFEVKNDLCENRKIYLSDKKFHSWIDKHKLIIFPKLENDNLSYEDDIKVNHYKYLKHMLLMNTELEKNNKKMFTALPLRTELYDKYVTFNTFAIKDIFKESDKNISNANVWNKYFNIDYKKNRQIEHNQNGNKINHKNWYFFNDEISTDGIGVSINLIKEENIEGKQKKSNLMAKKSKEVKSVLSKMTEENKIKYKEEQFKKNKETKIKNAEKQKELKKTKKDEFDKLSKEEKEKVKLEIKLKKNKYEYIEDAVKNETLRKQLLNQLNMGLIKYSDLGMIRGSTTLGKGKKSKKGVGKKRGNDILHSYSSARRIKETKRLKYVSKIDEKRKKTFIIDEEKEKSIKEYESFLSKLNSKTVNYDNFLKFSKLKINLKKLNSFYEQDKNKNKLVEIKNNLIKTQKKMIANKNNDKDNNLLKEIVNMENEKRSLQLTINNSGKYLDLSNLTQKLKWFGYINKQRHESNLLNELKEIYGKNAVFVVGDWNGKGRIKRLGMPNMGMKKLLSRAFKVYLINEHNSSRLCWKTLTEGKNLVAKATDKNGTLKYNIKLHSVITFEMGKNNVGCINRDYNACMNFKNQVKDLILKKEKQACFKLNKMQPPKKENKKEKTRAIKKLKRGKGCKKAFTVVSKENKQESTN